KSVSFDTLSNLYVVDNSGVFIITRTNELFSLAQPGTFVKPASVMVSGTDVVVLDEGAQSEDTSVLDVTVGGPKITDVSPNFDKLEGGAEVIITGRNFAPESKVVLGDKVIANAKVESASRI